MNGPGKATQLEARRRGDGAPIAAKVGRVIPGIAPRPFRYSRERGNPVATAELGSRFRGNDELLRSDCSMRRTVFTFT
ncbi:hypothetical protein SKP52_17040 [Sphingopyxis fribergensis]|uniref:Uncharacterized protein n=1 Tax=Sphingopyxis fribergensis TaxID=1515612 RepID=A0A0A7PJY4_9SPHN|nr:hypothetical protein SKP52_17040 [Sphingopyxis fribergensis]